MYRGHKSEVKDTKDELNSKHRFSNSSVKKPLEDMNQDEINLTLNEFINISADSEKIKSKAKELQNIKDSSTTQNNLNFTNKRPSNELESPVTVKKAKLFTQMTPEEKVFYYEDRLSSQDGHEMTCDFLKEIELLGDGLSIDILEGMVDTESIPKDCTPIQFVRSEITKEIKKLEGSKMKVSFLLKQLPKGYIGAISK